MIIFSKDIKYIKQIQEFENNYFKNNSFSLNELVSKKENELFNFCFYLNENNKVKGYAIIINNYDFIEIEKIAVDKSYRDKKIGSMILTKIKEFNKRIVVDVSNRDKTIEFYLKNDFKVISKRNKYYWDGSDAIVLEFNPSI